MKLTPPHPDVRAPLSPPRRRFAAAILCAVALLLSPATARAAEAPRSAQAHGAESAEGLAAIRRLPCTPGIPYLKLYNNTGELCFADAGTTSVIIYGVTSFYAGDNAGWMETNGGVRIYFSKYEGGRIANSTIRRIRIY